MLHVNEIDLTTVDQECQVSDERMADELQFVEALTHAVSPTN